MKNIDGGNIGGLVSGLMLLLRNIYNSNLNEIQARLKEYVDEDLTEIELIVFKREFEYFLASIGATVLLSKTLDKDRKIKNPIINEVFFTLFLNGLKTLPIHGNSHNIKDLKEGFEEYFRMDEYNKMINFLCKKVEDADIEEEINSKNLKGLALRQFLESVIVPVTIVGLNKFLDDLIEKLGIEINS